VTCVCLCVCHEMSHRNNSKTVRDRRSDSKGRYWETVGWLSNGTTPEPLSPPKLPPPPQIWYRTQSSEIATPITAKSLQIEVWTLWRGIAKPCTGFRLVPLPMPSLDPNHHLAACIEYPHPQRALTNTERCFLL